MVADPHILSERERQILRLVAKGATNQQIAHDLVISVNTVKVHVRNVFTKMGASSRAEAALYAVRMGLVRLEDLPGLPTSDGRTAPGAPEEPSDAATSIGQDATSSGAGRIPQQNEGGTEPVRPLPAEPEHGGQPQVRLPVRLARLALLGTGALIGGMAVLFVVLQSLPQLAPHLAKSATLTAVPSWTEQRWRELTRLPRGRAGFGLASYTVEGKQYLYVIGGDTDGTVTDEVSRYDPTANVWASMSPKPTAVTDVRAVRVGNRIYVPGGRLQSGLTSDQLEAYEPQRDRWLVLGPLPAPRSAYSIAAVEGKIYLFGGWDGSAYRAETWQYDPDSDTWRALTPMNVARAFAAAAVVDQNVVIVGGENEQGGLTAVQRYSPASEDGSDVPWSIGARIPSPVRRGDASSVNGLLMLLGFEAKPDQMAVYDAQTDSWRFSQVPLGGLSDFRVQGIGNKLYILGGRGSGGESAPVFEYQAVSSIFLPVIQ